MSTPEERLAELGLTIPDVVPPVATYVPAVRVGSLVYTAGQLPMLDGSLITMVDYNQELPYFNAKVLPLLEQAGLRKAKAKQDAKRATAKA